MNYLGGFWIYLGGLAFALILAPVGEMQSIEDHGNRLVEFFAPNVGISDVSGIVGFMPVF